MSQDLTPSAKRVLKSLLKGEATYNELLIRNRPMSEVGLTRVIFELDGREFVHLSKRTGCASITDAGREAIS